MPFYGKHGHLGSVEAAVENLKDIAANWSVEDLFVHADVSYDLRYEATRRLRTIEGLQMVIIENGGQLPLSWLPMLYKTKAQRLKEYRELCDMHKDRKLNKSTGSHGGEDAAKNYKKLLEGIRSSLRRPKHNP